MSGVRRAALDTYTARSGRNGFSFVLFSIRPEDQQGRTPKAQAAGVLEAANRVGTGLKISSDEQDTLFEAAGILVGAHRDRIVKALSGPPTVTTPAGIPESS